MNVAEILLSRGESSAPAVQYMGGTLSYADLRRYVGCVCSGLLQRGCVKGDRICIVSENSPFFIAAYLGVILAGLVAVPLPADLPEDSLSKIIAEAGIKQVLVSARYSRRIQLWASGQNLSVWSEAEIEAAAGTEGHTQWQIAEINPARDLAALMFTSGSTGAAKGVMVTHRNIECNTRDIISYLRLGSDDRVMVVLPFHYCFGASLLHTHLLAGGTLVLNNDFRLYPETVLQDMLNYECTGLAGVPSTYQLLLRQSRFPKMSFPGMRWFQQAGGKLPNPCIQEILHAFPHIEYFLMYGQTEATARLSYLSPEKLKDKLGSIGKGLPSTRLEVIRSDGIPVVPGSDEVGEIVASGDNIALGYWNDPAETAKYFRGGKLHTGDIARVDKDGFIFLVEREREMIKSGGNRVSAKEVEDVIAEFPSVVEVAVVGYAHDLLGEAIKAFAVLAPGAKTTPAEIISHCRKRLSAYKAPEEVIVLKAMPHNASGKVLKPKLREMLARKLHPVPVRHRSRSNIGKKLNNGHSESILRT